MLPAPNPPSDPLSATTVGLGEEEEEEGDSFVLGAFSPARQETTRAFGPAGQETTRAFGPAGHEPFSVEEDDIETRSVELESGEGDSAAADRREGEDTSAETERKKNEGGRVPVSFERKEGTSLKELTAKGVDTLTEDELPGPKDRPKPILALVPLTETTHGVVVGTTRQARPPGSTHSSGRLQTEVMSNADGPPGENLSEGERGAGGEVTVVEGNTRPVVLAGPEEEEEEQSVDQHATFPCPPPEPVCLWRRAITSICACVKLTPGN